MSRPSIIGAELQRLAEENDGELQPKAVVDAARDPDSPLHGSFTWDDSEAAEQWRLQQARLLIRAVVVYQPLANGKTVPCRVFVSLTPDREREGGGYRVATSVMSDADQRRQLLTDAREEMNRFKEKYRALEELSQVFEAMDAMESLPEEEHANA